MPSVCPSPLLQHRPSPPFLFIRIGAVPPDAGGRTMGIPKHDGQFLGHRTRRNPQSETKSGLFSTKPKAFWEVVGHPETRKVIFGAMGTAKPAERNQKWPFQRETRGAFWRSKARRIPMGRNQGGYFGRNLLFSKIVISISQRNHIAL